MSKGSLKALPHTPEWSEIVELDKISATPLILHITPRESEEKAIATRLGVASLHDTQADVTLTQMTGSHLINVTGTFSATVIQNCVVTLQPLEVYIRDEFEAWFADPSQAIPYARAKQEVQNKKSNQQEVEILDDKDDPESVVEGKIDIGELVVQYLSLSIDPYPRAPSIDPDRPEKVTIGEEISPFAALASLQTKTSE